MNMEINRLDTFANWPGGASVDPIRIAKAGFFYTGEGTEVECFSCGGKISQWNYGDQVMLRHRRMEPNCPFVVNPQLAGNVSLDLDSLFNETSSQISELNREPRPPPRPQPRSTTGENPDVTQDAGPTDEDEMYKSDALRLLSFINWQDDSISREALVSAGFYHAGEGKLRCAWCGGELAPFSNLGSLGAPLDIHRRYFPRCTYARQLETSYRNAGISPPSSMPQTPPGESPRNSHMSEGARHNARLLSGGGMHRCSSLGVVTVSGRGVQHPSYADLQGRLATYAEWPAGRPQAPQALAEAGFFFTGQDDQVCCFYCDGGLGKWEVGDEPWSEHARWFPECGYVQLVKGAEFINQHRNRPTGQSTVCNRTSSRPQNPVEFPITDSQVDHFMESAPAIVALGAGLDAARVRRAIRRRLGATGLPFNSSEALIDAALDEQLNEETWSMSPRNQQFARDILASALREFAPAAGLIPPSEDTEESENQSEASSRSDTPNQPSQTNDTETDAVPEINATNQNRETSQNSDTIQNKETNQSRENREPREEASDTRSPLSLEEENRQLKEARLCKVCMDSEVSVVFLPCGHLVSCARCGTALSSCPLCRSAVRALVRAYLA